MNFPTDTKKKFYIHTLGCKVNQYESQAMRESLVRSGFAESCSKDSADILILNTCTVTHQADRESRYWLGLFHRTNPHAKIAVTGCYVEKDAADIASLPGISHIIKNSDKPRIADVLNDVRCTTYDVRNAADQLSITGFKDHNKAFVKIQDGCENSCSYCKVPLVRGTLRSKPIDDIIKEVENLTARRFREIILTGICLGAWGRPACPQEHLAQAGRDIFPAAPARANLTDVLRALDRIKGDFRIRLSSIEPKYVTDELIEYISGNSRICRHLHIPLQSGDDYILKMMNRPYSTKEYLALIGRVRAKIKDAAVTTDVLAGFPGESDTYFNNTVNFLKTILPARTHIFSFSRRSGTPAYGMEDQVASDVLKRRYCKLNTLAVSSSYLYRETFLNKDMAVLVEAKRDRVSGRLMGYSDNYIKIYFDGPDGLEGKIVSVKIEDVNMTNTIGVYNGK